jgi:hypothetical protein
VRLIGTLLVRWRMVVHVSVSLVVPTTLAAVRPDFSIFLQPIGLLGQAEGVKRYRQLRLAYRFRMSIPSQRSARRTSAKASMRAGDPCLTLRISTSDVAHVGSAGCPRRGDCGLSIPECHLGMTLTH